MNLSLTITGSREELAQVLQLLQNNSSVQPAQSTVPPATTGQAPEPQQPAQAPAVPVTLAPQQAPIQQAAPVTPATVPTATAPAVQTAPQTAAPTSAPQYDFNQLASATMQLQQAGQNIQELFAQFGIQSLNQLPKERYGEYAAVLRQRGAKI